MSSEPSASPAEEAGAEPEATSAFKSEDKADTTMPSVNYFDVQELDEQERSLLVFMSLSSYMDWQERFLESYKEVLVSRATTTGSTEPSMSYGYYNALNEIIRRQRALLKPSTDDDAGAADSEADPNEQSWLRNMIVEYRVDYYLKFMIMIFLLKMPSICYLAVTVLYLIYQILTSNLVMRPVRAVARWRLTRYMVTMLTAIYQTVSPAISISRPFLSSEQPADGAAVQTTVIPSDTSSPASPDEPQRRVKEETDSASDEVSTSITETEVGRGRKKPSFVTKVLYQLFAAYLLSYLPWWEPNPVYLEEND